MMALRYSQPNPYEATDPATGLTSSVYNTGEQIGYRIGVEATADERWLRYDSLLNVARLGSHQRLTGWHRHPGLTCTMMPPGVRWHSFGSDGGAGRA